jgi:putative ABC transport system ATP-binding protein
MMDEVIRIENAVRMENGRRMLNGVTLRIGKGECVTISGPPGSGKSALARVIAGMDRPDAGEVFVLGQSLHTMNADAAAVFRNRHIGILARDPAFFNSLSLLDNVAIPLALRHETRASRQKKAKEQLKSLGLLYAAPARVSQLTPLERHKAAVARVLVAQPEVLLLDDFAVDLDNKDSIAGILRTICRFGNMTVMELTGACGGLICEGRTLRLEQGRVREETV